MPKGSPRPTAGRKWFDGKDEQVVVSKLEEAFAIGCTNREACLYSDITEIMYYNYVKSRPELAERFKRLRDRPILKARNTLVKGLDKDENAKWYLARKRKSEFAERSEHTGRDGEDLFPKPILDVILKNNSNTEDNTDAK